jgi:hypothetical protein
MRSYFADDMTRAYEPSARYFDSYSVDGQKAARMVKTFARIDRQWEKDGKPEEFGDLVRSFAKALKLSFHAVCERKGTGGRFSDSDWRFEPIESAVKSFRALVAEHVRPKEGDAA